MDYQLGPGPLQVDQNTIDEKIKGDIGIVENGDVATHTIPSGYYVIWKGDLYIAKTNISSGTTLSAESNGNLTAKPNGLGGEVAALNSNLANFIKYKTETATIDNNGYIATTLKSKDNAIITVVSVFYENYYLNAFRYEVLEYGGSDNTYTALRFIYWDGSIIGKNKSATVKYAYIEI